jgi:sugar-specific transcriptional regulator TrmB
MSTYSYDRRDTMDTPALNDALRQMGLSPYEAKCYLSLLERDTLTAPEVSKLAGIPRPSAYDALEKLMTRGMCSCKPGDTKRYTASDPALFKEKSFMEVDELAELELQKLRNIVKQREKEIVEGSKTKKESISNLIDQLRPQYNNSRLEADPLEYIEIIKDPFVAYKMFRELIGQSKEEIICFVKPPFASTKEDREENQEEQKRLIQKGVRIRTISETPKDKEMRQRLYREGEEGVELGLETRTIKELPMKMVVFDSRTVTLSLEDPVTSQVSLTTLVIKHRALARSLKLLFDSLWDQAQDYHVLKD